MARYENYYKLSEDEMQDLIVRAKSGDGKAQVKLVEVFQNFLSKYVSLLYYSKYSLNDDDVRRFLALYVPDRSIGYFLKSNKLTPSGLKYVNEVLRGINFMVTRYGTEDDIAQTVRMTFLQCVNIYERKEDIPFSGFIYNYFLYVLKRHVDEYLIDQSGRHTYPLLDHEDQFDDSDGGERPQGFIGPPTLGADDMIYREVIDELWVEGSTCHPPFNVLTIQERQLLKWRFVNGERSSEIAKRITEHPNTVREHFNRIRKKLQEQVALGDIDS